MAGNGNLYASRGTKEDEYYTDLVTIENELKYRFANCVSAAFIVWHYRG